MPLDLLDAAVFFAAAQRVREAGDRPGGLHVEAYEYRIGWSEEVRDWLVRWEYEEETRPGFAYPRAHLHVNATSANERFLSDLPESHFATQKMRLEQILVSVCNDIVRPRLVSRGKRTDEVEQAVEVLEAELAALAGRGP